MRKLKFDEVKELQNPKVYFYGNRMLSLMCSAAHMETVGIWWFCFDMVVPHSALHLS